MKAQAGENMKQLQYELPKKCRISTITIRETFGTDEDEAVIAAENSSCDPRDELVSLSITAVNGSECMPGMSGFSEWPTKTRNVVRALFDRVNDCEMRKLHKLIQKAEDGTEVVNGVEHIRYSLPDNCLLKWVTLREMMPADELAASSVKEGSAEEAMRRCIVDSSMGAISASSLKSLNTETRNILRVYWSGMNFISEDEIAPLAMAAEAVQIAVTAAEPDEEKLDEESLPIGSGSQVQAVAD